jgi:membrane peptidoglycan carboxypeptidase
MEDVGGYPEVYGGTIPASIWHDFMVSATRGMPVVGFPPASYDIYADPPPPAPAPAPEPSKEPSRDGSPSPKPSPEPSPEPSAEPSPEPAPSPSPEPSPSPSPETPGAGADGTVVEPTEATAPRARDP